MLERLGKSRGAAGPPADIGKAYRQQERHSKQRCGGIHAMSVSFEDLVHRPDDVLPQVAEFLGVSERLAAMRACIDPALHRARSAPPA